MGRLKIVAASWAGEGQKMFQLWQQQQQILQEVVVRVFESCKVDIGRRFGGEDWKLVPNSIRIVGRDSNPSAGYAAEVSSKKLRMDLLLLLNSDFSIKEIRHLYD